MSDYNELRRAAEQAHLDQQEMAAREITGELDDLTLNANKWQKVMGVGMVIDRVVQLMMGGLVGSFLGFAIPAIVSGKSSVSITGVYFPAVFAVVATLLYFTRVGLLIAGTRAQRRTQHRLNELKLKVALMKGEDSTGEGE